MAKIDVDIDLVQLQQAVALMKQFADSVHDISGKNPLASAMGYQQNQVPQAEQMLSTILKQAIPEFEHDTANFTKVPSQLGQNMQALQDYQAEVYQAVVNAIPVKGTITKSQQMKFDLAQEASGEIPEAAQYASGFLFDQQKLGLRKVMEQARFEAVMRSRIATQENRGVQDLFNTDPYINVGMGMLLGQGVADNTANRQAKFDELRQQASDIGLIKSERQKTYETARTESTIRSQIASRINSGLEDVLNKDPLINARIGLLINSDDQQAKQDKYDELLQQAREMNMIKDSGVERPSFFGQLAAAGIITQLGHAAIQGAGAAAAGQPSNPSFALATQTIGGALGALLPGVGPLVGAAIVGETGSLGDAVLQGRSQLRSAIYSGAQATGLSRQQFAADTYELGATVDNSNAVNRLAGGSYANFMRSIGDISGIQYFKNIGTVGQETAAQEETIAAHYGLGGLSGRQRTQLIQAIQNRHQGSPGATELEEQQIGPFASNPLYAQHIYDQLTHGIMIHDSGTTDRVRVSSSMGMMGVDQTIDRGRKPRDFFEHTGPNTFGMNDLVGGMFRFGPDASFDVSKILGESGMRDFSSFYKRYLQLEAVSTGAAAESGSASAHLGQFRATGAALDSPEYQRLGHEAVKQQQEFVDSLRKAAENLKPYAENIDAANKIKQLNEQADRAQEGLKGLAQQLEQEKVMTRGQRIAAARGVAAAGVAAGEFGLAAGEINPGLSELTRTDRAQITYLQGIIHNPLTNPSQRIAAQAEIAQLQNTLNIDRPRQTYLQPAQALFAHQEALLQGQSIQTNQLLGFGVNVSQAEVTLGQQLSFTSAARAQAGEVFNRTQLGFNRGFATQSELDNARLAFQQATAQEAGLRREISYLRPDRDLLHAGQIASAVGSESSLTYSLRLGPNAGRAAASESFEANMAQITAMEEKLRVIKNQPIDQQDTEQRLHLESQIRSARSGAMQTFVGQSIEGAQASAQTVVNMSGTRTAIQLAQNDLMTGGQVPQWVHRLMAGQLATRLGEIDSSIAAQPIGTRATVAAALSGERNSDMLELLQERQAVQFGDMPRIFNRMIGMPGRASFMGVDMSLRRLQERDPGVGRQFGGTGASVGTTDLMQAAMHSTIGSFAQAMGGVTQGDQLVARKLDELKAAILAAKNSGSGSIISMPSLQRDQTKPANAIRERGNGGLGSR